MRFGAQEQAGKAAQEQVVAEQAPGQASSSASFSSLLLEEELAGSAAKELEVAERAPGLAPPWNPPSSTFPSSSSLLSDECRPMFRH